MYVCVYGTLKKGHWNHSVLRNAKFVAPAIVRGFELFNAGFPVANRNSNTAITAEIYEIGDPTEDAVAIETLSDLDSLEGYYEHAPDKSMYHRVEVDAYGLDNETYKAGMYVGNPRYWRDFQGMTYCGYDTTTNCYTYS